MTQDSINPDGTVTVRETIEYTRNMSLFSYEMEVFADFLSVAEQEKVKKYITRITNGRIKFREFRRMTIKEFEETDR